MRDRNKLGLQIQVDLIPSPRLFKGKITMVPTPEPGIVYTQIPESSGIKHRIVEG